MEIVELIDRIEKLEAESLVLRRYLRALISLLPNEQPISAVLQETQRQINLDAASLHGPDENSLQKANTSFAVNQVRRFGYLASRSGNPNQDAPR